MSKTLYLLPILLLAGFSAARAADPKPFTINGDFAFESAELKDGKPVCNERWRFTTAGDLTIFSAQEVVTARYHVEPGEHEVEHQLVFEALSTNGQPDCRGNRSSAARGGEERLTFYFASAGNLVFCKSIGTGKDMSLEPVWLVYRAPKDDRP